MGTSGVKAALLDLNTFKLISLAMQGYDNTPQQPSAMLWDATAATIREAVAGINPRAVQGISISGQMHGTVMYDGRGEIIEPIINWQDKRCEIPLPRYGNRTTVEVMIERVAGPEFDDLGIDVLPSGYLGATLFYIKENDPALFERIHHVVLPGDFIRGKLLGASDRATDPTNAFGTGLFNTRLGCWHEAIIEKLGLSREILPAVHDSAEVAGVVPEEVACGFGLAPGTRVIYGGGDNQMSLLGNGLMSANSPALINIGTGAQVSRVTSQYAKKAGVDTRSYFNGTYAFVGASVGGGRSYAQLREALAQSRGARYRVPGNGRTGCAVASWRRRPDISGGCSRRDWRPRRVCRAHRHSGRRPSGQGCHGGGDAGSLPAASSRVSEGPGFMVGGRERAAGQPGLDADGGGRVRSSDQDHQL